MPRPRTVADNVVLDEAMRLIGEVGPSRLTLARIGDAVGLSPATLVQRFGSRRGLLLQLAGRDTDLWPLFARSLARHGSPLAALRAALIDLVAGITSPEALANHVAFLHLDLTDPVFHELALRHDRSRRRSIERLLGAALAAGELEECDPRALAETLDVTYNGTLITWAIDRRGSLARRLARQIDRAIGPYLAH
jgi:AcrR family transcriptional regulator